MPVMLKCSRCKGTGFEPLSDLLADCLAHIRKLGTPSRLEIHAASKANTGPPATYKLINRLLKRGLIAEVNSQKPKRGQPRRYRVV